MTTIGLNFRYAIISQKAWPTTTILVLGRPRLHSELKPCPLVGINYRPAWHQILYASSRSNSVKIRSRAFRVGYRFRYCCRCNPNEATVRSRRALKKKVRSLATQSALIVYYRPPRRPTQSLSEPEVSRAVFFCRRWSEQGAPCAHAARPTKKTGRPSGTQSV